MFEYDCKYHVDLFADKASGAAHMFIGSNISTKRKK